MLIVFLSNFVLKNVTILNVVNNKIYIGIIHIERGQIVCQFHSLNNFKLVTFLFLFSIENCHEGDEQIFFLNLEYYILKPLSKRNLVSKLWRYNCLKSLKQSNITKVR